MSLRNRNDKERTVFITGRTTATAITIMRKLGKELEFIAFVKRDGSGTIPVGTEWNVHSGHPKTDDMSYLDDAGFEINRLSLTHKTYIASGFNTWVVRLK